MGSVEMTRNPHLNRDNVINGSSLCMNFKEFGQVKCGTLSLSNSGKANCFYLVSRISLINIDCKKCQARKDHCARITVVTSSLPISWSAVNTSKCPKTMSKVTAVHEQTRRRTKNMFLSKVQKGQQSHQRKWKLKKMKKNKRLTVFVLFCFVVFSQR